MMEELKEDRLPNDRLSSLVQVAIVDAKRLYANRPNDYVPCAERYHEPLYGYSDISGESTCQICLAGAVIAGTLEGNLKQALGPSNFREHRSIGLESPNNDYGEELKLRALDYVRTGSLEIAYNLFYDAHVTRDQAMELQGMFGFIVHRDFHGWGEFMMHINSLELLVKELVNFEDFWGLVRETKETTEEKKEK